MAQTSITAQIASLPEELSRNAQKTQRKVEQENYELAGESRRFARSFRKIGFKQWLTEVFRRSHSG